MRTDSPAPPRSVLARVLRGTFLLVVGRLWGSGCTFVYLYVLAHHLDGAGFGRFTFYLALFALLDSLADLGTGSVTVQRTADDPGAVPAVLASARRVRLVAGSIGVLLVASGALFAGEPDAGWIVLASLYPVTHVLELSATVFKNRIDWRVPVLCRAFASSMSLAFVLICWSRGVERPGPYVLAVASGSALANVLLHLAARRHLERRTTPPFPWRTLVRAALPLGLAGLCQQAYFYVDNLFVRALVGEAELGHYNVGVRLMSYGIMVAVYASLAALPWFSSEHRAGRMGAAIARLSPPLFALAGAGAGLALPWAAELLSLFGPEFVDAAASLRWLVLAAWMVYLGSALLTGLVATGRTGAVLVVAASGLAVNLAGNALLVPRLGIDGAAIATLATEAGVALGAAIALGRLGVRPFTGAGAWRWLGGPLALGAALALSSLVREALGF